MSDVLGGSRVSRAARISSTSGFPCRCTEDHKSKEVGRNCGISIQKVMLRLDIHYSNLPEKDSVALVQRLKMRTLFQEVPIFLPY